MLLLKTSFHLRNDLKWSQIYEKCVYPWINGSENKKTGKKNYADLLKVLPRKVDFEKNSKKGYRAPVNTGGRTMSDADFNARKRQEENRVDAILDKISKSGYDSLTKEERDFLYNYKR